MTSYKWTTRLTLISLVLLLLVMYVAGGGHGSYLPAIFLFPWALLAVVWSASISSPVLWLVLVQYPVYGLVLDKSKENEFYRALASLVISHVLLAGTVFLNWPDTRY
jgi:hypothetical protein